MGLAAGLGLGLTAVGMGVDAYGQSKKAAADKRQALVAQTVARQQALDAISRGDNAAARAYGAGSREVGSQIASTAGRGFEVGTGTAQNITDATDLISSIDALTIRQNARREASGDLAQAYSAGTAAKDSTAKYGIAGTLIAGASTLAARFEQRRQRNKAILAGV